MKASLVLAANVALSLVRVGLADECHNICADVKKGVSSKSGCSAFRNSLPRPKISSKCQSGFKAAVDMNCYDACANGGYLQPFVSERRLDEVCNGALKETPRPLCHDACVQGFRSGMQNMTTFLVKRMAEGAPKAIKALKRGTSARQKVAQRPHVTAATADPSAVEELTKIASANSKVAPSSKMVEPGFSGTELLDAEVKEPLEGGETKSQEPEEVESVDAITVGESKEVHGVDEEPAGEIDKVENEGNKEVENQDNAGVAVDVEVREQLKAGNDEEDIYKWIEEENKVLLSLPITVDNVEKELAIFEGDEPMDVVLEFCRDNLPGDAGCADELIGVVVDKIYSLDAQ